ncbi:MULTISPECIES: hypothetical protein [unclassified Sinorhizobium]|uniref:hypothetical protein n=1 Tax=unclassified Sinorhizobium TaxID=2613772 RepID=UPI0024C2F1B5|nr:MULTISPECIES: hypothetical protein [unclassified Sinorhizobium]MDK1375830.1 hypothetical protein [Sinorhizobium sp. 6-70]MDK1481025.1 hypothetical protein [Sinorhizobium sp. 6-117]
MSRWIRVQTSIFDHEVFAAEPFTEREAWLWLISRAAWKDTVHRVGASVVTVKAGSVFIAIREMQVAWRWASTRRVHRFLELLSSQNMIETSSETGKTCVTISNYAKYQNAETASETPHAGAPKQKQNTKDTSPPDTNPSSHRSEERAPAKPTPRAELLAVLDEDHAEPVLVHRQRLRKPLTARAAQMLAKDLSRCPDPNAAADEMLVAGWLSVKPEWLENRRQPRSPPTSKRERSILDVIDERLEQQNAKASFFDEQRTIEHESGSSAAPVIHRATHASRYRP